ELPDLVQVDDLVVLLEPGVAEALELRHPTDQGHLTTLERDGNGVTSLRALGTATRGLALGTLTTTLTGLGLVGARGRPQVMQLEQLVGVVVAHCATSSTVTRCETTVICPCTAGLSSRTGNVPIRPRPSERRAACCFSLPPTLERPSAILLLAMATRPRS